MEIRKMCGCPVEIVCDHYVLPGVLKVPCPFCVEKDTALAQKTAECTTFFDDGVKVLSRIAELEEEVRQLAQINRSYEEQIAESAAVYAERDRLQEAVVKASCGPRIDPSMTGSKRCLTSR